jgi:hypothetical protein
MYVTFVLSHIFSYRFFFSLSHLWRCVGLRWINVDRTGLTESGLGDFLRSKSGMAFKAGIIYSLQ